jgi:hypothetical protein
LQMPSGRWVSIEVTYLHPRFENEERRWRLVTQWIAQEEQKIRPTRVAIECQIAGQSTTFGTRVNLPAEHERKRFLGLLEVKSFLSAVSQRPNERHRVKLADYDVTLLSRPRISEADRFGSSSGPVLEVPKTVGEHAAYRALRQKLAQHRVDEPHIVCIGSDLSQVLTGSNDFLNIRLQDALRAALRQSVRLSAVLIVSIKQNWVSVGSMTRRAECTVHPVDGCRYPLSFDEIKLLGSLNLNRWKYTFPLSRKEELPLNRERKVGGSVSTADTRRHTMKLTIPTSVLVDILAGRKKLADVYGKDIDGRDDGKFDHEVRCLAEGWAVVGCKFVGGNIEQAESARVELELSPPHEPVFWEPDAKAPT